MLLDPNTALAPTFSVQDNQDVNSDGTIDIAITLSWLPVTGAKRYDVEVSRSDTSGGPWTVTGLGGTAPAGVETYTFKANTNKFYKARVRARNFAGVPGAWTTDLIEMTTSHPFATYAGFQPVGKSSGPTAPSVVTMGTAATPLGFPLSWAQITDADYIRTDVATGVNTTTPPSDDSKIFASVMARGVGASPTVWIYRPWAVSVTEFIWIKHVNASGNSSAWVFAGTYTSHGLTNTYLADDAADTPQIKDGAVTYAKLNDPEFLVRNATSALSVGDIGTYAMMKNNSGSLINSGTNTSGSNLAYSDSTAIGSGSSPGSGTTWQSMGRVGNGNAGIFLRVS